MEIIITREDVESAYLRLKRAIYYENNILLHLKMQLAEFEYDKELLNKDIRDKYFENFAKRINKNEIDQEFLKEISDINYKKVIKKFENNFDKNFYEIFENNYNFIKNNIHNEYKIIEELKEINRINYNYFIDCSIELHIISVLWITKFGYELESQLDRDKNTYSYGYRLDIKNEKTSNINTEFNDKIREKSIFKRYYKQYQKWKYNGIKEIRHIREKNENAIILNLDLKRFYYHIDRRELEKKIHVINEKILESNLTKLILKINEEYAKKLITEIENNEEFIGITHNNIIPIGIYSSAILANIYLKELDDFILDKTSPNYYGRYVDDIFLVYEEYNIENLKDEKDYILKKMEEIIKKDSKGIFYFLEDKNVIFNLNKMKLLISEKNKGKSKILELEESILEKASTFAFLPNEKEVNELYKKICINSNENEKKYNVSVYLSKLLVIFSYLEKKKDFAILKDDIDEILYFFSDENLIKFYIYYEKIFLLLVINDDVKKIQKFYKKVMEYFMKNLLIIDEGYDITEYLETSLCFALSLKPSLIIELEKLENKNWGLKIREKVKRIISSNLFKQNLINYPLLNYTFSPENKNWGLKPRKVKKIINSKLFKQNLINYPLLNYKLFIENIKNHNLDYINFFDTPYSSIIRAIDLDLEKIKLTPRFLHFSEFNNFYLKKIISKSYNAKISSFSSEIEKILEKIPKEFSLNFRNSNKQEYIFPENIKYILNKKRLNFYKIKSSKNKNFKKIKVGVASLIIKENLEERILKNKASYTEKEELIRLLNLAKVNNINILVFPEISIPYEWLTLLNKFSRENQILITGGFTHLFNHNIKYDSEIPENIFNFLFTILPFKTKKYKTSFVTIRLKNYYSPMETNAINGYFYSVPISDKKYDIFSWEGIHFSNFNCFELTDIEGRSRLKNYIDLLISSVYNRDVHYFENILESTCRDLHVFVAQSNTSTYGNCEILQPSGRDTMILASIKGGESSNLLIEEIDIESLRNFQLKNYSLQKDENKYKLTPPGMNLDMVNSRKDNRLDEYFEKKEENNESKNSSEKGDDIFNLEDIFES